MDGFNIKKVYIFCAMDISTVVGIKNIKLKPISC